ncbi:hypothetical protein FOCC_FOCC006760 [Frankliniella occidentalis]|nr:hypothetical protein FOCC_FOCC006760 [Frankliniella occidentalis]
MVFFILVIVIDPVVLKRKRQKYADDPSATSLRHFQEHDKSSEYSSPYMGVVRVYEPPVVPAWCWVGGGYYVLGLVSTQVAVYFGHPSLIS